MTMRMTASAMPTATPVWMSLETVKKKGCIWIYQLQEKWSLRRQRMTFIVHLFADAVHRVNFGRQLPLMHNLIVAYRC